MNRGVGRRAVFERDADRERFLGCLVSAAERHRLEIHAYCLLGNHYHLLLRSLAGELSSAMQWLSSRYTQSLNYDRGRDGPLFRGRYASVSIGNSAQLLEASRYIHLNPVVAGLAVTPESWPWASARWYLGDARRPSWLAVEAILAVISPGDRSNAYRKFLDEGRERHKLIEYERLMSAQGVRPAGSDPGKVGSSSAR